MIWAVCRALDRNAFARQAILSRVRANQVRGFEVVVSLAGVRRLLFCLGDDVGIFPESPVPVRNLIHPLASLPAARSRVDWSSTLVSAEVAVAAAA